MRAYIRVKRRHARRAITSAAVSGVLAVGLLTGAGTANADVLDDIADEYASGAGGGQVSNLIHDSLTLRARGFRPSQSNMDELRDALTYRPNQGPLVEALKDTVAHQEKLKARAENAQPSGGTSVGINQLPPGQSPDPRDPDNTGIFIGPSGGTQQPIGR